MVKSLAICQVSAYTLLSGSQSIDKTSQTPPMYPCIGVKATKLKGVQVLVQPLHLYTKSKVVFEHAHNYNN